MSYIISMKQHWRIRRSEWMLSIAVLSLGFIYLLHPTIFDQPTYSAMRIWLTPAGWATLCLVIGVIRLTMLYINGRWRPSPHLRMLGAFLSCFLWMALFLAALGAQAIGAMVVVWLIFAIFDALTAMDAASDARDADDRAKEERVGKDGID